MNYSGFVFDVKAVLCIYFLLFSLLIYANWTSFNHNSNDNDDEKSRKKRRQRRRQQQRQRRLHEKENNNHSNNHNNNNVVNGNVINHVNSKPKFHFVNFVEKQMTTMTLTQADYSLIRMEPMIVKQHDNHHYHHYHHRPFGLIFYATRIIPKTIKSSLKRLVAKFNQQQQQQQSSTTSNNNGSNLESPPDNGSHRQPIMDQYSNQPEFI